MKRNGFAQIPVMIGLLIMAVAVPVATKLVQQSQDTRNKAAGCAAAGELSYSGHPCCPGLESYDCSGSGSFSTCKCRVKPVNPTATPVPPSTRTCTWKTCETTTCRTHTEQRPSSQACPASNCSSDANCHIITPTPLPTMSCGAPGEECVRTSSVQFPNLKVCSDWCCSKREKYDYSQGRLECDSGVAPTTRPNCAQLNDTCIVDSNCCNDLVCKQDGQSDRWSCQTQCKANGLTVSSASECCSGYAAYSGSSLVCGVGSKPCCCNSGDYGSKCFWSDTVGRCHTTQSVDPYQGTYANPVVDTSKCSGTNPTATPNIKPPVTPTLTTTCGGTYQLCCNATTCKNSSDVCMAVTGGKFCIPKPGTTGNPTIPCTSGTTKCQSEIANISYEYKCTNGSWVKDKRCDGACNGNVCASFTKCTEGETKCNNTTKVFEKCVKVGSAATGYTTNWQGTYCENGCNSSGCLSASPTGSHTNPSPTNKAGAGSGCDGAIPRDICDANKLSINAQCVNNSWDYDEQLCDQTGRKETCGGRPYCCPSAGGQWTTDMTACGGSGGACTQCAGHPDWKVKGDADCSGTTSINDFSVWKSEYISGNFGTDTKNSWNADFNCDGKVTLNDGSIWTANFIKGLTN